MDNFDVPGSDSGKTFDAGRDQLLFINIKKMS